MIYIWKIAIDQRLPSKALDKSLMFTFCLFEATSPAIPCKNYRLQFSFDNTNPLGYSPLRGKAYQPTIGLASTSLQIEKKDHPASLGFSTP